MKWIAIVLLSCMPVPIAAVAAEVTGSATSDTGPAPSGLPELTPEQLERYQFENKETSPLPKVTDLSSGQQYILDSKRSEIKELIALRLGILSFNNTKEDLRTIQQLYDRKIITEDQVADWQSVGVLFGDILSREFGLHWVNYEDELGASRALQWRTTQNFVFPITVFSKRLQFAEPINVEAIYSGIKADIEAFKARETRLGREN